MQEHIPPLDRLGSAVMLVSVPSTTEINTADHNYFHYYVSQLLRALWLVSNLESCFCCQKYQVIYHQLC